MCTYITTEIYPYRKRTHKHNLPSGRLLPYLATTSAPDNEGCCSIAAEADGCIGILESMRPHCSTETDTLIALFTFVSACFYMGQM